MSLQAITMAHERLLATRNGYTWVHKYVFPGGALPSHDGHRPGGQRPHYAAGPGDPAARACPTCRRCAQWRHQFNDQLPEVRELGFDETFVRMWNFYLAYTEAGFAAEYLDDWQLGLARA